MPAPVFEELGEVVDGAEELDLFCTLTYTLDDELVDDLVSGRRRPQWMWVALRGEHLVARAAWWGSAGGQLGLHPKNGSVTKYFTGTARGSC